MSAQSKHLLDEWFIAEGNTNKREGLLKKCSALLIRDSRGKLTILSAPKIGLTAVDNPTETSIIAFHHYQQGNLSRVSIPLETLYQKVVGFLPVESNGDSKTTSVMTTPMDRADEMWNRKMPTFNGRDTFIASLPTILPLPLEFQIRVKNNDSSGRSSLRETLAKCHPCYVDWIDSADYLCRRYQGKSIHKRMKCPAKLGAEFSSSIFLVSTPLTQELPLWKELDDDTHRADNMEDWLLRSSGCKKKSNQAVQDQTPTLMSPVAGVSMATRVASMPESRVDKDPPAIELPLEKRTEQKDPSKSATGAATKSAASVIKDLPPMPELSAKLAEMPPIQSPFWDVETPTVPYLETEEGLACLAGLEPLEPPMNRVGDAHKRSATTGTPPVANKKAKPENELERKIHEKLAECHHLKILKPPILLVSIQCGYTSAQSRKIAAAFKGLREAKVLQNAGSEMISLTNFGIETMPCVNVPRTNTEVHSRLKLLVMQLIKKEIKSSNGKNQLEAVWKELADGEVHSEESLARAAGYTSIHSKMPKLILKTMKDLGIISEGKSKTKTFKFTDKVFPFGRPAEHIIII